MPSSGGAWYPSVMRSGFGPPSLKKGTFHNYIKSEPVQYVGWKQFFKPRNDNPRTTIAEILRLWPRPIYIQYQ